MMKLLKLVLVSSIMWFGLTTLSAQLVMDGDSTDWANISGVTVIDNLAGAYPDEVGALVSDRVDLAEVKATVVGNVLYTYLEFHGGPAWPNTAYVNDQGEYKHRGYYHILFDVDNDATTGWNSHYYEGHYTPVGYLASQGQTDTEAIGTEIMLEWGASSQYHADPDSTPIDYFSYWSADYSGYDGQTDDGDDYEIYDMSVEDTDVATSMMWEGALQIGSTDSEALAADSRHFWNGHGWGHSFIEFAVEIAPLKKYYADLDIDYFNDDDEIALDGFIETKIDAWGTGRAIRDFIFIEDACEAIFLSIQNYNNIKIKGFNSLEKNELVEDAYALCKANVFAIVIEAVAESAARVIVKKVKQYKHKFIPTIGIGASASCNGQILVTEDMLGFSNEYKAKKTPKFVKVYKSFDIELSVKKFCDEVRSGIFPNDEYFYMKITPVILSGGSGTSLWPLSRKLYPKQYLPLVEEQTMLQATLQRLEGLENEIRLDEKKGSGRCRRDRPYADARRGLYSPYILYCYVGICYRGRHRGN